MLRVKIYLAVWCWIHIIMPAFSAKILGIFPLKSKSHFAFNEAVMRSLATVGHQVTIVAPYKLPYSHNNITVIDSKVEGTPASLPVTQFVCSWLALATHAIDVLEDDCYQVMSKKEIQSLENFDIVFVELLPMCQCFFPIAKKFGVPIIGTSSHRSILYADYRIANPRIPAVFSPEGKFVYGDTTFYKRLLYFVEEVVSRIVFITEDKKVKKFYETFFPGQKPIDFEISWLFTNNFANIQPRPLVPNAIDIGGIHVKMAKLDPLPEPLKKFIDEAPHGVILFSWGSLISQDLISTKTMNALKNTFAKIPQRVIWNIQEPIEGFSENIWTNKWLPQKEILAHKNVLAFISHCGVNGMYEAIYFGKPVIPVPQYGDQMNNAGALISLGVAPNFNFEQITETNLLKAINDVIHNEKYRQNMELLSKKLKDELNSPSDQVVYWTEYVLRYNGSSDLRSKAVGMPWYQYLLLDVIVFITVSFVIIISILVFCIKRTIRKLGLIRLNHKHYSSINKKIK